MEKKQRLKICKYILMVIIYVLWFILVNACIYKITTPTSPFNLYNIINVIVLVALLVLINLNPTIMSLNEDVKTAEDDYNASTDSFYSEPLQATWIDAIHSRNKYYIFVFMILVYLPVFYLFFANYQIPYPISLSAFFGSSIVSLILYEIIHGANAGIITLIIGLILFPFPIAWIINCYVSNSGINYRTMLPLLFLSLTIVALIIYTIMYGIKISIITALIALILFPFPLVWMINCFTSIKEINLTYMSMLPILLLLILILSLIIYTVIYGIHASIILSIIALILLPFPLAWVINCIRSPPL